MIFFLAFRKFLFYYDSQSKSFDLSASFLNSYVILSSWKCAKCKHDSRIMSIAKNCTVLQSIKMSTMKFATFFYKLWTWIWFTIQLILKAQFFYLLTTKISNTAFESKYLKNFFFSTQNTFHSMSFLLIWVQWNFGPIFAQPWSRLHVRESKALLFPKAQFFIHSPCTSGTVWSMLCFLKSWQAPERFVG